MEFGAAEYKLSGKPGKGLLMMPLAGLATAGALGIAYGFINVWNPLIYFTALATFFYGMLLGFIAVWTGHAAKCRSRPLYVLMAFFNGLAGLFAAWAGFCYAFCLRFADAEFQPTLLECFTDPSGLLMFMNALSENGWFSLGRSSSSTPVSGVLLIGFWIVEAGLLLGTAVWAGWNESKSKVFCEACDRWCEDKKDVARAEYTADPIMLSRVKTGDLNALAELNPPKAGAASFFRLDHQLCGGCGNMGTVQVTQVLTEKNKEGKIETKETALSGHMLLQAEGIGPLAALMERGKIAKVLPPPPADPAPPPNAPPQA